MATMANKVEPIQQVLAQNRYGVRSLETQYLRQEYGRMQQEKYQEKMVQKMQKEQDLRMLNQLNDNYLQETSQNRFRKLREMKALSEEYQGFIQHRQDRGKNDRYAEQHLEKSTLQAPTWIRDVFTDRETQKKNMEHYNRELSDHLKMKNMRKEAEREQEEHRDKRRDLEAGDILKRERQELEARHRQKSMFEHRQNQLLGVRIENRPGLGSIGPGSPEATLRRREQDLYSQGLEVQLRREQEKRHSLTQDKMSNVHSNIYNPITNPMPFIYKNPNVLRMMANN